MSAGHLYAAIHDKCGGQVIPGSETRAGAQLRFMLRVAAGNPTTRWLGVIDQLLRAGDEQLKGGAPAWTVDISKQYFRRPGLKYGWRIIFQNKDSAASLDEHLQALAEGLRPVVIRSKEQEEIPLYGSPNRSKTAGPSGTVPLGPAAVRY